MIWNKHFKSTIKTQTFCKKIILLLWGCLGEQAKQCWKRLIKIHGAEVTSISSNTISLIVFRDNSKTSVVMVFLNILYLFVWGNFTYRSTEHSIASMVTFYKWAHFGWPHFKWPTWGDYRGLQAVKYKVS